MIRKLFSRNYKIQPHLFIFELILFFCLIGFLIPLVILAFNETGGSNSYAVLADAFLNGRLDVDNCFDLDCVKTIDGRNWVIFPPAPALLIMPFIAEFGAGFSGFHFISLALGLLSAMVWQRNFLKLGLSNEVAWWLVVAAVFATPLIMVIYRANLVWFFAQTVAFLLLTLAIYEALHKQRAVLIGVYIAFAFLSRQMSIFYAPLLFVMILSPSRTLFRFDTDVIKKAGLIALPILMAISFYYFYNWIRFGDPSEDGYRLLIERSVSEVGDGTIRHRLQELGLFSKDYVFFNLVYLFFQGFHFQFSGDLMLTPIRMDRFGTSIIAGSPFVLIALLAPIRREHIVGWLTIIVIVTITLFYHSNGFWQINTQRFSLDWLPIIFILLARAITLENFQVTKLLIIYAMVLNLVALGLAMSFGF